MKVTCRTSRLAPKISACVGLWFATGCAASGGSSSELEEMGATPDAGATDEGAGDSGARVSDAGGGSAPTSEDSGASNATTESAADAATASRVGVEEGEWAPGGETTNTLVAGDRAFTFPAENLDGAERAEFFSGNAFFNQAWVEAPSSTTARDGLGPTFNARSCSTCHFKDGRGRPPEEDEALESMLFRLSVPDAEQGQAPKADSTYGGQLQPFAIDGVGGEGNVRIQYEEFSLETADGEIIRLRRPSYELVDLAFGEPETELLLSPRVAPQMIGMGLLEAIPEERLLELVDDDDEDGDGISGRVNRVWNELLGETVVGRFGWKAEQPTVAQQVAGAFLGDMGITTEMFPHENCPPAQEACAAAENGGEPECSPTMFERVVYYSRLIAPPARDRWNTDELLLGKTLFGELGCADCHVPSHTTGQSDIEQLSGQLIWPYTDLLLHDMGEELSDERPSFAASGAEWRTPPLWGIGRFDDVNGHTYLLHDGRARGVQEAIVWHGGEAEASRESYLELTASERDALVHFVESL